MKLGLSQLRKLSGLHELRVRSTQELHKIGDRILQARPVEMSDNALFKAFAPTSRNGSGEGTAELTLHRLRKSSRLFAPTLNERAAIIATMQQRFPDECAAIINSAERACEGTFDLLGYRDLNFGQPIDWHLDPCAGVRTPLRHWSQIDPVNPAPGVDPKIVWELNRHAHFVTLAQAYWLTDDERFVKEIVQQTEAWIDANPVGLGINWASSIELAFRAIAWLWALHLCADSQWITPSFVARQFKSLLEQGRHIEKYLSTYFSPNTHLTGEALGLFYLGTALPELRDAARWRKLGLRVLLEQLPRHVRADGVYFEQSSYYHRYTTDFYLHLQALLEANQVQMPEEKGRLLKHKLEHLYEHLRWLQRPDGTSPLFGDDDGGRLLKLAPRTPNDFRDTLATGVWLFERSDWKHSAGAAPAELLWLFGLKALEHYDQLRPLPPNATARAFSLSGYFVLRSGWDRKAGYALFDCGRHGSERGPGHAHSDALSFEFAANGVTWIVDPGTFVYGADAATRDWFRSTEAHNTVVVDRQPQSQTGKPFSWLTIAESRLLEFKTNSDRAWVKGEQTGYQSLPDPVTHTRSLTLRTDKASPCLTVNDRFQAQAQHHYALRFHLTPDCLASAVDDCITAETAQGETLAITVIAAGEGKPRVKAKIENGWVSTCYGQRTAAPVAVFEVVSTGVTEITSTLVAMPSGNN